MCSGTSSGSHPAEYGHNLSWSPCPCTTLISACTWSRCARPAPGTICRPRSASDRGSVRHVVPVVGWRARRAGDRRRGADGVPALRRGENQVVSTTTEKPDAGTGDGSPSTGASSEEEQSGFSALWERRSPFTRRTGVVVFTVLSLFVIAAAGLFYAATKVPLPDSVDTEQTSSVTYRDGKTEIVKIGSINRTDISLDAVSEDARNAVLAAENRNFYAE